MEDRCVNIQIIEVSEEKRKNGGKEIRRNNIKFLYLKVKGPKNAYRKDKGELINRHIAVKIKTIKDEKGNSFS